MTDTIELSTREAADAAGIPYGTLKSWLAEGLPVPFRTDSRGARRYGPEAVEVLQQVAKLRNQDGRNLASIRVMLAPEPTPAEAGMAMGSGPDASRTEPEMASGSDGDGFRMAMGREADEGEMGAGSASAGMDPASGRAGSGPDLAAAIADAVALATTDLEGRMIAVLREQTDLAEKYARAAHQIGKLEADNEHQRAQLVEERERHARELAEARQRIALLEAPKPAEKPWWRRWT